MNNALVPISFQVINIQNFNGVLGDVANSSVSVHDYSSIHQILRNADVSQKQRNELENIMDELKDAAPAKKPALLERANSWIVKNQEILGAYASIVRKALSLD